MKEIDIYERSHPAYPYICTFAQEVYRERLCLPLTHFPEVLFAIHDDRQLFGCIGLNSRVGSPLFLNDERLVRMMRGSAYDVYGEQCLLALQNCSVGLLVLIAAAAAYAGSVGIDKIVCAAIGVSQRTIRDLDLDLTEYGPIHLETLPEQERPGYATWHALHHPVGCVVGTSNAAESYRAVLERFSRKLRAGPRLEELLAPVCA